MGLSEEISRIAQELDAELPNLPPESEIATSISNEFRDWLGDYQKNFKRMTKNDVAVEIVSAIAVILRKHGAR